MKLNKPIISVIIPTYKDWDRLDLCLSALESQSIQRNKFEIIVINNDITPTPTYIKEKYKRVFFIAQQKKGSYAARNKGIIYSKGSILAFTDSDCIPDKNWLLNAINSLNHKNKIYRIGGKIALFRTNSYNKKNIAEIYEYCYAFRQKEFIKKQKMAVTANMICYKFLFEKVGLFNENLFSGGDSEWGKRAYKKGYNINYEESVIINHPARNSLKEILNKNRREAAGKLKTNQYTIINIIINLFLSLLPPIKSIFYINKKNTFSDILIAFTIRYLLRIDTAIEQLLVGVIKKDAKR
ncbi:glycosyltransferase [Proteus mirabilis]|uniref:glycosyltransferase n=1 Tax=Proteus mirabilis TaxID=584 RepID=UPI002024C87D|nr:glycosyltransferase [Proteus mirabilis]MCL8609227.1 glycosyltransferase [Proteus mirabilis]MCT0124404.1 glycosyltransferase [Proteus mirabilis]MDF7337829.1 glycosyltransferase [Proteus mirabilis]